MRTCSSCKLQKDGSFFGHRNRRGRIETLPRCKSCCREAYRLWRLRNPGKVRDTKRRYYARNAEKIKATQRARQYWRRPSIKRTIRIRLWMRERRKDPQRRILSALRCRIWAVIKAASKSQKTFELLGCRPEAFFRHLERLFLPGMVWNNYGHGINKWNIDHIRPCASFDLTDPEQQRQCFHYTNLQPLWASDNYRKNAKY